MYVSVLSDLDFFFYQKPMHSDDAKLEATKRRLQESYQQAKNGLSFLFQNLCLYSMSCVIKVVFCPLVSTLRAYLLTKVNFLAISVWIWWIKF